MKFGADMPLACPGVEAALSALADVPPGSFPNRAAQKSQAARPHSRTEPPLHLFSLRALTAALLLAISLLGANAAEPAPPAAKPLRILPLGDSITRGSYLPRDDSATGLPYPDGGGYRKPLQDRLRAAGIAFDFVGSLSYGAYGRDGVVDPAFDADHHGLAGFSNAAILKGGVVPTPTAVLAALGVDKISVPGIATVLGEQQPDIVLLMSGANGFDAAARDRLIRTIGEHSRAHLLVATILPQKAPRAGRVRVDAYNASLPAIVEAQQKAGHRITLVDMHAALADDDVLADGVHPTKAGMDKMAAVWFTAIQALLPKSAAAEPASAVPGKVYDLIVVGGTPGGISCAVRAAREGSQVLLVNHTRHLGGFMSSGAGGWEAPYDGLRSPLYGEIRTGAANYYRDTYGEGSPQHLASMPSAKSRSHLDRPKVEPRVAELLFDKMANAEPNLTVLLGYTVSAAQREGRLLKSLTLKPLQEGPAVQVSAKVFADGMYEGDLIAAAGVTTQLGRESRSQYNEPHAGVVYTKERHKPAGARGFPEDADKGRLNIRYNNHATAEIVEGPDSGQADKSVMAYNYRLILTREPANRIAVTKPANYDAAIAKAAANGGFVPNLPNQKVAWNGGRIIGPQNDYPSAGWPAREAISRRYLDAMLMALWYVQNDPDAPKNDRERFASYGLAADEFADNNHVPYEIYVREARRLVGRYVFTEHDNKLAAGIGRTPIHSDSIAITDWPLDSVACLNRKAADSSLDGIFFLSEESRPAQVPYRSLLAKELDNLLVPVALSASHVGWGAIRLEPCWMQAGESAGFAAALAVRLKTTPAQLDPDLLIRTLAANHLMLSFFNDVDVTSADPRIAASQYFGTKGFFADYNARLDQPLKESTRRLWQAGLAALRSGTLNPMELATQVQQAETAESPLSAVTRGQALLEMWQKLPALKLSMEFRL